MADMSKFEEYGKHLNELLQKSEQAERDVIVAETNHKNLIQQKEKLIQECETFIGAPYSEAPKMLQQHEAELDRLMQALEPIDVSGNITPDTITALNNIVDEFGIKSDLAEEV